MNPQYSPGRSFAKIEQDEGLSLSLALACSLLIAVHAVPVTYVLGKP